MACPCFNLSTRNYSVHIELLRVQFWYAVAKLNHSFSCLICVAFHTRAYAGAKLRFPGREWLSSSVLLIYLIPAIILVIPLYAVFSQLGLRNSLLGLCIVYPATTIPSNTIYTLGLFSGLQELDDRSNGRLSLYKLCK